MKFFRIPWPMPKKSPMGTSMEGSLSPSHHARRTILRGKAASFEPMVIQICLMQPGPSISPSVFVSPGSKRQQS